MRGKNATDGGHSNIAAILFARIAARMWWQAIVDNEQPVRNHAARQLIGESVKCPDSRTHPIIVISVGVGDVNRRNALALTRPPRVGSMSDLFDHFPT